MQTRFAGDQHISEVAPLLKSEASHVYARAREDGSSDGTAENLPCTNGDGGLDVKTQVCGMDTEDLMDQQFLAVFGTIHAAHCILCVRIDALMPMESLIILPTCCSF